jgi:hypothetical protein
MILLRMEEKKKLIVPQKVIDGVIGLEEGAKVPGL